MLENLPNDEMEVWQGLEDKWETGRDDIEASQRLTKAQMEENQLSETIQRKPNPSHIKNDQCSDFDQFQSRNLAPD